MIHAAFSPVPLRQVLLSRVAALVGATVILVAAGFVVFGLIPMADRMAEDQFDTATMRIETGLNSAFSPTTALLAMSRNWLAGEAPDLNSPDAFNRLFQPVLEISPQITSVVAGTSSGQGWLLLQQPGGSWRNRMTDIPRWGERHLFIDRSADGRTQRYWEDKAYDPRKRPWFQLAQTAGKENIDHWTSPYVFFTTGDPGISASTLMHLRDGREFVLGFDLMLRDLSQSTLHANVGEHGFALVITDDERVLALPALPAGINEEEWLKRILKPAAELGLAPLTDALNHWNVEHRREKRVMSYSSGGSRWLASIRPHALGEQQFWVVIAAPAGEFSPAWFSIISALAVSLMMVVVMALWVVRRETRRLTRPLEILAKVNEQVGQLDFRQTAPVKSRITEIRQLASAQEAMLEMLRNNQLERAELAEKQKHQIEALLSAETRLTRQNTLLNTIFESFPGGISVFDADLRLAACNAQFKAMMDLPECLFADPNVPFEHIIRFNAARGDYGPGDPEQQVTGIVDRARNFQPHKIERVRPNGMALEIHGMPLPGGGFVTIYLDITERKQQQERARQLLTENEAILNNAMVGIAYVKQRLIVSCNRRLEEIFQYAAGELVGSSTERLYDSHETFERIGVNAYQTVSENRSYSEEVGLRHKDGSLFWGVLSGRAVNPAQPHEGSIWIYADITERKRVESDLRESEARYRTMIEWSPEANVVHRDGILLYVNPSAIKMFGATSAQELVGKPILELIHPDFHRAVLGRIESLNGNIKSVPLLERKFLKLDGTVIEVEVQSTSIVFDGKEAILGAIRDVTERKKAAEALRIAATAFDVQEGMTITDAANLTLRVNRAFTEITGFPAEEVIGKPPSFLSSGRHGKDFYQAMWESITQTGSWQGEIWNRRKSGEVYPAWLMITAVKDDAGLTTHYVGTFSDITSRKTAEEEIRNLAFYDPLTRLPNRRLLLDRLKQTLAASTRSEKHGALLFIDLDNFKTLNDTLGHDIGDLLLQQVAQRLNTCVREGDTVARLGGDEFVVMLEDLSDNAQEAATQTETVGEKILSTLNQPYQLASYAHHSTPSIGVTLFVGQDGSIDELMKRADLAMYQAKAGGRNTLRFFDPEMQAAVSAHAAMDADLREALATGQFILHYQAQVIGEGRLTGTEVLLRWLHPQRGMVSPAEFIPLAEESGLILPLGHWVMQTACSQLALWAKRPAMAHLTIAVNVSPRQFRLPTFVEEVLAIVGHTGANPQRLKLELTESLLVEDVEDVIAKMTALKARGVGFSLDDFGTGYSSLSYLKRLPLDQLKIDQGFVRNILTDPNDAAIAKMVVALAESMGLAVIAEGVELEAQRDFLARHGCHAYQGYRFSRPLPLEQFEEFAQRV
jgi:diguanylate cyclase (GGDEF)-like protein/PAS domain S-box-containing protein